MLCKCKVLFICFRAGVYSVIMDINWVISYTASWCLKIILRQCLNYLPSVELNSVIIAWLMIKSLKWILYITAQFNILSFSKHILCRQTCIQIYLLQNPYEDLRTNEIALCSLFSNYCTYQRKPPVVFVLLSFEETDHIQASWESYNYKARRLFTRYDRKEQTINLFSFVP